MERGSLLVALLGVLLQGVYSHRCGFEDIKDIYIAPGTSGELKSPGYPGNYPDWNSCYYRLRTDLGHKVRLSFIDFELDATDACIGDYMGFYDGPEVSAPWMGRFCSEVKPADIESSQNALLLTFISDFRDKDVGRGFHFKYQSLPEDNPFCPEGQEMCRNRNCYSASQKCNTVDDCGDGTDEEECKNKPFQPSYTCGTPKISPKAYGGGDRIVGGVEATAHSWPWQVSLQVHNIQPCNHFCGGSLIDENWVLTAAHCVAGIWRKTDAHLRFGVHNKFLWGEGEHVRYIKKLIVFNYTEEEFFMNRLYDFEHDFALIQLNAPITFTDHILPICLPDDQAKTSDDSRCMATGWGMTKGSGSYDKLKQVSAPITETLSSKVKTSFVEGEGACNGDSGGPLVCQYPSTDKWTLYGVASHIVETNKMTAFCGYPGMYARVSTHMDWIKETMKKYS